MSDLEQQAVAELTSADHFIVCAALKRLATLGDCSDDTFTKVLECCSAPIMAVERSALNVLIAAGPRAQNVWVPLVSRLSERLHDAGCTFDCCGFGAFHGPIDLYIDALCSMTGTASSAALAALLVPLEIPADDKVLIAEMVAHR